MTIATIILLMHLRQRELQSYTNLQLSLAKPIIKIIQENYPNKLTLPLTPIENN